MSGKRTKALRREYLKRAGEWRGLPEPRITGGGVCFNAFRLWKKAWKNR
jgi:hypothetical protein